MQSMKPVWFCDRVDVTINKDGSLTVQDHGRGMTGMHAREFQLLRLSLPFLHAGGNSVQRLQDIGGLHGVGSSVVNALSSWLKLKLPVMGQSMQRFENGENLSRPLKKIEYSTQV